MDVSFGYVLSSDYVTYLFWYGLILFDLIVTVNLIRFWQDKTFGLKNKKGAKQQKFIKAVTQQVKCGQQNARQVMIKILILVCLS